MTSSSAQSGSSQLANDALITPKAVRLSQTAPRCPPSEYDTDPFLRHMTKGTRRISNILPLSTQHKLRDDGTFRWIADSAVTSLAIPLGAIACPSAAKDFVRLSKNFTKVRYGDHESQFMDVFLPDEIPSKTASTRRVRGMVFFVHGGAWGSGKPWFYRLVAKPFLEVGFAVTIVGYRVYPLCGSPGEDRGGVLTQVDDLEAAFQKLTEEYPEWCDRHFEDRFVGERQASNSVSKSNNTRKKHSHHIPHLGTIVIGHSSGSHISLLWMVEEAQKRILGSGSRSRTRSHHHYQNTAPTIDSFVGISGVYNIGDHFDYEAGRGVEEISPMKPACGYDRINFARNSPPWKVQHELLRTLDETKRKILFSQTRFPDRILLVHGSEDDVVPLPGTGEAAKILRNCLGGASSNNKNDRGDITIDECYVPTGHQETVVDLMMLGGHKGPVTQTVVEWLLEGNRQLFASEQRKEQQKMNFKNSIRRSKL